MGRKRTNRRVWNTQIDTINHAKQGAAVNSDEILNRLRLRELASIDAFDRGCATIEDVKHIVDMLNICETMALGGIGPEALPVCEQVESEMREVINRYEECGQMEMVSSGVQTLRNLYEFADLQRSSISRSQYEEWINRTVKRIRNHMKKEDQCS